MDLGAEEVLGGVEELRLRRHLPVHAVLVLEQGFLVGLERLKNPVDMVLFLLEIMPSKYKRVLYGTTELGTSLFEIVQSLFALERTLILGAMALLKKKSEAQQAN